MGSGRRGMAAAKKLGDAVPQPTPSTHTLPDSKAAVTQHADQGSHRHFPEAPAQSSQKHQQKFDQQCSYSDERLQQVCSSPAGVEGGSTAPACAELKPESALRPQLAQRGMPAESDSRTASSTNAADTAQSLLHSPQGRRYTSSDLPTSRARNAVADLSQQPLLADCGTTTSAESDEPRNRSAVKGSRGKRKDSRPRKPGPPAFPQLPYERSLQQQQSECDAGSHCTEYEHGLPLLASDTARQTCAQTDMLADAMQRQLQLRERRAEGGLGEGQEGPQQRLSQHGGYMQRGSQERLPCRRTTRSMLRGADTQTGKRPIQCQPLHAKKATLQSIGF